MKASDLALQELLDVDADHRIIQFAGQRALLLDAVALGLLRAELIHLLGVAGARGVLTRFGFAHGWRTAESLKDGFPWDDPGEWRRAGGRLHALAGLVRSEPVVHAPGEPEPFAESIWQDSYEAEQHLLHQGLSDEPVCWTLCGFASGYLSYCNGQRIICREVTCRGKGDATCHMIGKPEAEWGEAIAGELRFYSQACLHEALDGVTQALKKAEQRLRQRKRELAVSAGVDDPTDVPAGLIAKSDAFHKVIDVARRVARVDSSVLVTGESGVGKERIAQLIHASSERAARPFVAVNCSAVTETLLESELFGHARGAFTGATQDRPGLFEAASGGTLFLDEVGEIPPPMQAKLLRVLQEREVRRVGENRTRAVNVRVVAATNRDLAAEVERGAFRKDLYYRLRVVEIRVPPLRERKDDILPLARLFLADAAKRMSREVCCLSPAAADQLLRHPWPGNVRELGNAMERAVALAGGDTPGTKPGTKIDVDDLPEEVRAAPPAAIPHGDAENLDDVERAHILATLERHRGNQAETARALGIGTATLYRKLKRWGGYSLPRADSVSTPSSSSRS